MPNWLLGAANPRLAPDPDPQGGASPADGGKSTKKYGKGKFETPEQLDQAYEQSSNEGLRLFNENKSLKEQNTRLAQLIDKFEAMTPKQQQNQRESFVTELEESGIPVGPLAQMIESATRKIAREEFQTQLKPLTSAYEAQNKIVELYPDYPQFAQQIDAHLQSNPALWDRYKEKLQKDPLDAMEWGYAIFRAAKPNAKAGAARASASGAEEQAEARRHAANLGAGGGAGGDFESEDYKTKLDGAYQHGMKSGDFGPYMRLRLKGIVDK